MTNEETAKLIEDTRALKRTYDEAMASQPETPSNACLIVMANYGELALSRLPSLCAALEASIQKADGGVSQ